MDATPSERGLAEGQKGNGIGREREWQRERKRGGLEVAREANREERPKEGIRENISMRERERGRERIRFCNGV
jgi:hypothetical protein